MKSLVEVVDEAVVNEGNKSVLDLINKYLDPYTVIMGGKIGSAKIRRRNYLVVCKRRADIKEVCKGIWSIIAEWQGRDKPEENCIKYMTALWESAWDSQKDTKEVKIPFDLFDDEAENKEYGVSKDL